MTQKTWLPLVFILITAVYAGAQTASQTSSDGAAASPAAADNTAAADSEADTPLVLTVEKACELALKESVSLQKEAIDLEMDRIRAKSLWAEIFPSISAGASANYTIPVKSGVKTDDPSYTATARVSLTFNSGLPYTIKGISLAYKSGLLNYEDAKRQLELQTKKSFYSLLAQKQNLEALENTMKLAADQLERDRIARRNGYIGELDFMSANVSAENAKLDYNRAKSEYETALSTFLSTLGLYDPSEVTLEGLIETEKISIDAEELIGERLFKRPDIVAQRNEIEQLRIARNETAFNARGPSLSLSGSMAAAYPDGLNDTLSAGISVSIPIDPWVPRSKQAQGIKRADSEYDKAVLDLRDLENAARTEIRSYQTNLENAWAALEISRLQLQYAQRAFELSSQAYRMGTVNFLDFETTRDRLSEARQQELESVLAYKLMVLDLAASLNMDEAELRGSAASAAELRQE